MMLLLRNSEEVFRISVGSVLEGRGKNCCCTWNCCHCQIAASLHHYVSQMETEGPDGNAVKVDPTFCFPQIPGLESQPEGSGTYSHA